MEARKKELIEQLKAVRLEKGLSYQYIADQCEARGKAVSLSTIKRVFSGAASGEFRFDTTLQPISEVVLGIREKTPEPDLQKAEQQLPLYYSEVEAMKQALQLKGEIIDALRKSEAQLTAQADYMRQEIARKNKLIAALACVSVAALAMDLFGHLM